MNKSIRFLSLLVIFLGVGNTGFAEGDITNIVGMVGPSHVTAENCAAIWLPVPDGKAVTGVRWYNNDSAVVFPQILLVSGEEELMVDTSEAVEVAIDVVGPDQSWGEFAFDQAYACQSQGLYCVFMFPDGADYLGPGSGVAFGYSEVDQGQRGWLGGAENTWIRIGGTFSLAIEPIIVDEEEGMHALKSMPADGAMVIAPPELLGAHPNPFNPQTVLEYSIPKAMAVELSIFDVRGQRTQQLVNGVQDSGSHLVTWSGDDESGRRVASGVYFARFVAGNIVQSQRLLLVK